MSLFGAPILLMYMWATMVLFRMDIRGGATENTEVGTEKYGGSIFPDVYFVLKSCDFGIWRSGSISDCDLAVQFPRSTAFPPVFWRLRRFRG